MTAISKLSLLAMSVMVSSSLSHADPADGGDVVVEMSAYNHCESGGDQTAYSSLKPSKNNLDTKSSEVSIIAVPSGSPLKGQCFTAVGGFGKDKTSQEFLGKMSNRTFVAADLCPFCTKLQKTTGKLRVDVATSCTTSKNALAESVHLKPVRCSDKVYQALNGNRKSSQTAHASLPGGSSR